MLYAVLRSERDSLHFLGEVSNFNLQILHSHMREAMRDQNEVHVRIEVEPHELSTLRQETSRWLPSLSARGVVVEVQVAPH